MKTFLLCVCLLVFSVTQAVSGEPAQAICHSRPKPTLNQAVLIDCATLMLLKSKWYQQFLDDTYYFLLHNYIWRFDDWQYLLHTVFTLYLQQGCQQQGRCEQNFPMLRSLIRGECMPTRLDDISFFDLKNEVFDVISFDGNCFLRFFAGRIRFIDYVQWCDDSWLTDKTTRALQSYHCQIAKL
ncbi:MAG: hypothetical protein H6679_04405 [Epsilonproteobacteria bacterium]|nr:hypothetical protein [Campylobacterota bacterium]